MRAPSAKALTSAFRDLTPEKARLIRKIAKATDANLEETIEKCCPETQTYVRSLHSSPFNSHMWRVTVALHAINDILETHGVEALGPQHSVSAPPYEYLNTGDTYATTLIYKRDTDNLFIGNWGDIAERHRTW